MKQLFFLFAHVCLNNFDATWHVHALTSDCQGRQPDILLAPDCRIPEVTTMQEQARQSKQHF